MAVGAALAAFATAGLAQDAAAPHTLLTPSEFKWGPAPAALPRGSTMAVLSGDPGKPGPFVLRVKAPAGYKIMPHWHPTDENLTILAGSFAIGMADTFDEAALKTLTPGSFVRLPAEMRHFGLAKTNVVFQVHGVGPFVLTYVNPADDPRKAAAP
jgi:hypothetical protein